MNSCPNYESSRRSFLAALYAAGGAHLAAHKNSRCGPAGEALYTDIARIWPADPKRLLVRVSGTHGIEGYAGLGCHAGWLAAGLFARQAGPDTAVLFVHAINPFGFAWGRRTNEDNVDLNRNFIDHAKPSPSNVDNEAPSSARRWRACRRSDSRGDAGDAERGLNHGGH